MNNKDIRDFKRSILKGRNRNIIAQQIRVSITFSKLRILPLWRAKFYSGKQY